MGVTESQHKWVMTGGAGSCQVFVQLWVMSLAISAHTIGLAFHNHTNQMRFRTYDILGFVFGQWYWMKTSLSKLAGKKPINVEFEGSNSNHENSSSEVTACRSGDFVVLHILPRGRWSTISQPRKISTWWLLLPELPLFGTEMMGFGCVCNSAPLSSPIARDQFVP